MEHLQRCLTTTSRSTRAPAFPDDFITDAYRYVPPRRPERPRGSSSTSGPTTTSTTGQRWSTWLSVEPLCRGPEPRPDWVVTSQGAIDTELGILKTGKEADVFLARARRPARPRERRGDGRQAVPREEHRTFHRAAAYTEGRRIEALARRAGPQAQEAPSAGRSPPASGRCPSGSALVRLWNARAAGALPGPDRRHRDPDGVDHRRETARRRPGWPRRGPRRDAAGVVLRAGPRGARALVQNGDRARRPLGVQHPGGGRPAGHHRPAADRRPGRQPSGMDFLLRDCANICAWFRSRGLDVDEHALFGELMAHAF